MSNNRVKAALLINTAKNVITKGRPGVHGDTENSFAMIGELWTVYLRHVHSVRGNDAILPQDVAQMMSVLKKCRAVYGDPLNEDNFVDDLGYVALAGMLQLPDPLLPGSDEDVNEAIDEIMSTELEDAFK